MPAFLRTLTFLLLASVAFGSAPAGGGSPPSPTDPQAAPFWQLSSGEMKSRMEGPQDLASPPGPARDLVVKSRAIMYESRLLAEQFFAATGEARKLIGGQAGAGAVRDVAYEIVETLKMNPVLPEKNKGPMDTAWVAKLVTGPCEWTFMVKPSDGKPLEQYRVLIGVQDEKRVIAKVERDASFDAAAMALDRDMAKIADWLQTALKGKPDQVIAHLPKGPYPYIDAPVISVTRINLVPKVGPVAQETVTQWEGDASLWLEKEGATFWTQERILLGLEKKNDTITITSCKHDEAFAGDSKERVAAAQFILNYVSQAEDRAKWLAAGGNDALPKTVNGIAANGLKGLPYAILERKRIPTLPFPGDPGQGKIYQVECMVQGAGLGDKYQFRLVSTGDSKQPFLMFSILRAQH